MMKRFTFLTLMILTAGQVFSQSNDRRAHIGNPLDNTSSNCGDYAVPENPITRKDYPDDPIELEHEIHIWGQKYSKELIYMPSADNGIAPGRFPLAVLLHGRTYDYDAYTSIQRRLAHNGIASISVQYSQTHSEADYDETYFYEVFEETLKDIYTDQGYGSNPLHGRVLPIISIIGHSMGGGLAVYAANRLVEEDAYGLRVRSVMALAPNPQADKDWHLTPETTQGLLVLFGSNDADPGVNSIWNSGFYTYDRSGHLQNEYTNSYSKHAFTKSLVYLKGGDHQSYLDNSIGATHDTATGYIAAYARWSLLNDQSYRVYFRHGQPLDTPTPVSVLTSEPYRRVLENFEGTSIHFNTLGGQNTFKYLDIEHDYSAYFTGASAHHTDALRLKWSSVGNANETPTATFRIPMPMMGFTDYRNLSGLKYFSFRAGQINDSKTNTSNPDILIRFSYFNEGAHYSQSRHLSDFGTIPFPFAHGQAAKTKSIMNTIIVPLCAFDEIPFTEALVTAIEFEFGANEGEGGHIQLDSLEFF